MKRIAIAAFTERGCALALRLARGLRDLSAATGPEDGAPLLERGLSASVAAPERIAANAPGASSLGNLDAWCGRAFAHCDALVFVGAAGIAVRAIAPHVRDKFADPAVVSVDERARFAVPLLSGHVGRANDLARTVARITGAQSAVSTATDVNGVFAVDEWAVEQGLVIADRALAKKVSAALLEGAPVGFASDFPMAGELPRGLVTCDAGDRTEGAPALGICVSLDEGARPFAQTLVLVPRIAALGVGCRRGTAPEALERAVSGVLRDARVSACAVRTVATIDVKRNEPAVLALARSRGTAVRFFNAEELNAVPGSFASSAFVRDTVGTDNVCERAAVAATGGGRLVVGKRAGNGTTVACAVPCGFALSFAGCRGNGQEDAR